MRLRIEKGSVVKVTAQGTPVNVWIDKTGVQLKLQETIPTGQFTVLGPYLNTVIFDLQWEVNGNALVENIAEDFSNPRKVFEYTPIDVILPLGQSNADGFALNTDLPQELKDFYDKIYDTLLCPYKPTTRAPPNDVKTPFTRGDLQIYRLGKIHSDETRVTHQTIQGVNSNVPDASNIWHGLELGLGKAWYDANPNKYLAVIKCALGSSKIEEDWRITGRAAGGVYDYFLNYIWLPAKQKLEEQGFSIRSVKVFWMQGEGDVTTGAIYRTYLQTFVDNINADIQPKPTKIIIGGLSSGVGYGSAANILETKFRQWDVAMRNQNTELLPTDGTHVFPAVPMQPDDIHYSAVGYQQIGQRVLGNTFSRKVNPLSAIISSTCIDLDSTVGISANTTSNLWRNLCVTPADTATRVSYDMFLGANGSAGGDDPTFTGIPDDSGAYYLMDGNDILTLSGANTAFLANLHRTDTTQSFWVAFALRYFINGSSSIPLLSTGSSGTTNGLIMRITESSVGDAGKAVLRQRGDASGTLKTLQNTPLVNGQDYVFVMTVNAGGGAVKHWTNSETPVSDTVTYSTATAVATSPLLLGRDTASVNNMPNLTRLRAFSAGNGVLTDTQAKDLLREYRNRHQLAYA